MKKRLRKDSQTYYVALNIAHNTVSIHTTQSGVAAYTGICRTTLYKNFYDKSVYSNNKYTVWYEIPMYLCNKNGNDNLLRDKGLGDHSYYED